MDYIACCELLFSLLIIINNNISIIYLIKMTSCSACCAQVRLVDFSPNEKYLITYSSQDPSNPREKATVVFNVFDIRTGRKLRNFTGSVDEFAVGAAAGTTGMLKWPVFKWAGGPHDK